LDRIGWDLAIRDGNKKLAQEILEQAQAKQGDSVGLRLARLRMLVGPETPETIKALAQLETDLEKFTAEDQAANSGTLAEAHLLAGRPEEARRLWNRAVQLRPNDLNSRPARIQSGPPGRGRRRQPKKPGSHPKPGRGRRAAWVATSAARLLIDKARQGDKSGIAAGPRGVGECP